MLTGIRIENFKSFINPTIIDFKSTNYKILKNTNMTEDGILKGAIFVGGNGSGKTNIIQTIKLLLDLLFKEKIIKMDIFRCLFSPISKSIKLEYEFIIENNIILYAIEYNSKNSFMIEKLKVDGEIVLERVGNNATTSLTENRIHDNLENDSLLLRTIYFNTRFNNFPILKKWFDFMRNSIYVDPSITSANEFVHSSLICQEYLNEYGTKEINKFFDRYGFDQRIEYGNKSKGNIFSIELGNEESKEVFFKRQGLEEPIPYVIESLGYKNLINMLPAFFKVINNGGMLVIDEFSSAFHNELEELLIRYFMENSNKAQIFLVSHSTNLLSNTIFRPDQEYSVKFDGKEGSIINRFSNDKPREAQNIEKMYNSGCFDGKPEYKEKKKL